MHGSQPTQRIQELPGPLGGDPHRHRVGGEIAADQIVLQSVAEAHLGIARYLVIAVGPERGDLQSLPRSARTDCAEVDSGVPQRVGPRPQDRLNNLGPGIGGEVQVGGQPSQDRIAHAPADEVQLIAGPLEDRAHLTQQRSVPMQLDGCPDSKFVLGADFRHVR